MSVRKPDIAGEALQVVLLICSGFLLGCAFSHWRVDYGVLWHEALPGSIEAARIHYTELIHSPPYLNLGVVTMGALAIGSLLYKLVNGDVSSWMFDGGSLVLYSAIAIVYAQNLHKASAAIEALSIESSAFHQLEQLKYLASSNCIIAVALTGVLTMQSAEYYSNKGTFWDEEYIAAGSPLPNAARSPSIASDSTVMNGPSPPPTTSSGTQQPTKKRSSTRLRQQGQAQAAAGQM